MVANAVLRWISLLLVLIFIGVMIAGQRHWNMNRERQALLQPMGYAAAEQTAPGGGSSPSSGSAVASAPSGKPDKLVEATDPAWLYTNGAWSQASESGWGEVKKAARIGRKAQLMTNSPSAVLKQRAIGGTLTVTVDKQPVVRQTLPADGSALDIPLYKGAAGWHTIEITFSHAAEIDGLWIESGSELKQPASPAAKKLVVLGHSYVEGGNATDWGAKSFTALLGGLLGVETVNQGVAGTDVAVNSGKDALDSGLNRYRADVVAEKPDYVLLVYGLNAIPSDPRKMQADYTSLLTALRKELPSVPIFVSGIVSTPSYSDKQLQPYNASIQNAVKATSQAVFIDLAGAWTTVNYAQYVSSDQVLPTDAGHQFLADKYAAAIKPYLK